MEWHISDKVKTNLTEKFIRTCNCRDSVSVLSAMGIIISYGVDKRQAELLWNVCDPTNKGRLTFGEFLVACFLASKKKPGV